MLVSVDNIMLHTNSVDSNTLFFQEFRYKTRIYIWAKLSKHLKTSLGRAFKMLSLMLQNIFINVITSLSTDLKLQADLPERKKHQTKSCITP